MKMLEMLGRKFSKLLVIEYAGVHRSESGKHHQKQWLCKCDCGNELIVLGSNLRNGHTKTCGNCRKITDFGTYMKYTVKNGREFLFDFCDLQFIKSRFWTVADSGYVETHGDGCTERLHRLLLNPKKGMFVDHINGNRSDCRRCNLRILTNRENLCNAKISKSNTSGYKGVSYDKSRRKYSANIYVHRRHIFLGYYDKKEAAAVAYNKAAVFYFGEYARINFIEQQFTTMSVLECKKLLEEEEKNEKVLELGA